jgi:hypothetical protein
MDARILELLPWYVNGTLAAPDRAEIEGCIVSDAAYQGQIEFFRGLRLSIRHEGAELDKEIGLVRTLALIESESASHAAVRATRTSQAWWRRFLGEGGQPPLAFMVAASLVVLQTGVISYFVAERSTAFSETRSRAAVVPAIGPFVKVSFRPDATEAEVRFLLIGLGASIVGGPSQLGDYFLFLDAKRIDWVAQQLRQSPIVDAVSVIATLPASKE